MSKSPAQIFGDLMKVINLGPKDYYIWRRHEAGVAHYGPMTRDHAAKIVKDNPGEYLTIHSFRGTGQDLERFFLNNKLNK